MMPIPSVSHPTNIEKRDQAPSAPVCSHVGFLRTIPVFQNADPARFFADINPTSMGFFSDLKPQTQKPGCATCYLLFTYMANDKQISKSGILPALLPSGTYECGIVRRSHSHFLLWELYVSDSPRVVPNQTQYSLDPILR